MIADSTYSRSHLVSRALGLVSFAMISFVPCGALGARVIEEAAIPFTAFLSKADFDDRFPGEEIEDLSLLDPGWYVIYEHESLSYYFGPVLLESTGHDYLEQLREIVGDAVDQRPTIEGYRLELSFEPSAQEERAKSSSSDETQSNDRESAESSPPQSSGFWGFIKRIFGF